MWIDLHLSPLSFYVLAIICELKGFLVSLVTAALRVRHGNGGPLAPTSMHGLGKQTTR